jgi:hypothetical protein
MLMLGRQAELLVVTCRPDATAALDARGLRGVVLVDAPTYAGAAASPASPALLRLAGGGVPVTVIRAGDDLAAALAGGRTGVRSA